MGAWPRPWAKAETLSGSIRAQTIVDCILNHFKRVQGLNRCWVFGMSLPGVTSMRLKWCARKNGTCGANGQLFIYIYIYMYYKMSTPRSKPRFPKCNPQRDQTYNLRQEEQESHCFTMRQTKCVTMQWAPWQFRRASACRRARSTCNLLRTSGSRNCFRESRSCVSQALPSTAPTAWPSSRLQRNGN